MTLNKFQIIPIIIIIALIVPIFYLVQYLDTVFSYWWNMAWIAFVIAAGILIRKTGFCKRIPQPQARRYSSISRAINATIAVAILSGTVIYITIVTKRVSLPLVLVFGGLIASVIVIYIVRSKISK
jgi:hypothetical protein